MNSNKNLICHLHRKACFKKFFFKNLFQTRSIVFLLFIISSLIVQHVAEQIVNNKPNKIFNSINQYYSTKTASSKEKLIPESDFNTNFNPVVIQTKNGKILGKRVKTLIRSSLSKIEEHDVDAFLGLPYGKAPDKELRFQRPLPLDKPWYGYVFNATTPPDSCIQLNDTFFGEFRGSTMWNANTLLSEDCLTLNLWAPAKRLNKPKKLLPVLVWIYGGAFYSGSITLDLYDGAILSARGDVLVISINYRVASFGFLFLDREDAPGNVGIVDQILAIKWIKNNVRFFGGDPDNITLFGESAGAATITFLLASPLISNGLFHRAILQSGAITCPWALTTYEIAIYRSLRLAENCGCIKATQKYELDEKKELVEIQDLRRYKGYDYKKDQNLVKCLQKIDALELLKNEPNSKHVIEFPFVPVVDRYILPDEPSVLIKRKNFKPIPVLLGSVTNEANYFLVYQLAELLKLNETINVSRKKLENIIRKHFDEDDLILDAIVQKYTNWKDPENVDYNLELIDHVFGDNKFSCPVNEFARIYAEINSTVYQYVFTHRSSFSPWPNWMGILHGDEINYIFGEPLRVGYNYSAAEIKLSERMIAFWVNFGTTGDPLKSSNDLPQLKNSIKDDKWYPFTSRNNTFKYLNLNIKESVEFGSPRPDFCSFWLDYLPKFREKLKQRILCNSVTKNLNSRLVLLLSILTYVFNFYRSGF